ncbi:MAG: T9SS type A sorting domain-containing protein [Bacteroidia bacterium]|nr:T9SS type A sorting domain-containing protein [Bacteroidia bacterium]
MRSGNSLIQYMRLSSVLIILMVGLEVRSLHGQIKGIEVLTLFSGDSASYNDEVALGSILVDSTHGRLICMYYTTERDLPVTVDAYQGSMALSSKVSVYIAVYDLDVSRILYASYLGGNGYSFPYRPCWDETGGAVIFAGHTNSTDFPVTENARQKQRNGEWDLWYARFDVASFRFTYISYLGGDGDEARAYSMVTSDGRLMLAGFSNSTDLPINPETFSRKPTSWLGDAAVFVLRNDSLEQVVFFGGLQDETFRGLYETNDSFVFVGDTWSWDLKVTGNAFQKDFGGVTDMFILRTDKQFRAIEYCSYVGGITNDFIYSTRQQGEKIHIVGMTNGTEGFPLTHPAIGQDTLGFYSASYVIYDAARDEIPFSGLIVGHGAEEIIDVAIVDDQRAILSMASNSDTLLGVLKTPQGDWNTMMMLLVEFDLSQYQPTKVHYLWNGSGLDCISEIIPSPLGWYFTGYTGRQIPVRPGGMRTQYVGGGTSFIGKIHFDTNEMEEVVHASPRLLTITPYPNPAGKNASIVLMGKRGSYTLHLYGMDGRLYSTQRLEHSGDGASTIPLPLTGLAAGRYLLVAQDAEGIPVARSSVVVW